MVNITQRRMRVARSREREDERRGRGRRQKTVEEIFAQIFAFSIMFQRNRIVLALKSRVFFAQVEEITDRDENVNEKRKIMIFIFLQT